MKTRVNELNMNRLMYTADWMTDEISIKALILSLSSTAPKTKLDTELRRINPPTNSPI